MSDNLYLIDDARNLIKYEGGGLISTTWENLKSLRDEAKLSAGALYRITDYTCCINSSHTTCKSAGHQFDIIVIATSNSTLSENALAMKHDGDTYFQYCNLSAWKLKYCLDNDQTRFPYCASDGKGVIWWMLDEYDNEAFYDFKNVLEKRYEITATTLSDYDQLSYIRHFTSLTSKSGWTINTSNEYYFYTFSCCIGSTLNIEDLTVQDINSITSNLSEDTKCFGNNKLLDRHFINNTLNSFHINCFLAINGKTSESWTYSQFCLNGNILGESSYGNTFNCLYRSSSTEAIIYITFNTFGRRNRDNTFGPYCRFNSFGENCKYNSFGENCNSNSFGKSCNSNSFGADCDSNSLRSNCKYNSFGASCDSNSFGSYCYSNSLGADCYSNSFGADCQYNSLGSYCRFNSFGKNCNSNSFGESCNSNSFGESCNSNSFGASCDSNSFGVDCDYWTVTSSNGCFVGPYVQGTSSSRRTISSQTRKQYWS